MVEEIVTTAAAAGTLPYGIKFYEADEWRLFRNPLNPGYSRLDDHEQFLEVFNASISSISNADNADAIDQLMNWRHKYLDISVRSVDLSDLKWFQLVGEFLEKNEPEFFWYKFLIYLKVKVN